MFHGGDLLNQATLLRGIGPLAARCHSCSAPLALSLIHI